jgi:hypothetical protein
MVTSVVDGNEQVAQSVGRETTAVSPGRRDGQPHWPTWVTKYTALGGIATISSVAVAYALQATYLATFGVRPDQIGLTQFIALSKLALSALAA